MLRICLVEDEEYALKSLHKKISNLNSSDSNCSYEVVGTAYNGIDALEVIAKTYPNVVITDILMSDMDGISLIEYIQQHYQNIITVIVSGYQEFEYVKKAIKFGVEDYLLKPVILQELQDCLQKCEQTVSAMRNRKNIDDIMSEIEMFCSKNTKYFLIYLIFGNAVSNPESIVHINGFYIQTQDVERMFQDKVGTDGSILCFIGICSNEKVIIVPKGNISETTLVRKLHEFASDLERKHTYSVTISYRIMETNRHVDSHITHCRAAAILGVLPGLNNIVPESQKIEHTSYNTNDYIEIIALCIRQAQLEVLNHRIKNLFEKWQKKRYPLCAIQNDLIYITNSLKHSLLPVTQFEFTITYYIENIVSVSNTYMDMAENYYNLIIELFELFTAGSGQALSPAQLVEKIEWYFQSNLSNNLTLAMLCSEMNYSKVYLCRIFKKVKNTTPIDYFIQLKIEKAKNLVQEYPSMPLKDIASSLGFNDVYYFSKVFKRITGHSPTAAREKI